MVSVIRRNEFFVENLFFMYGTLLYCRHFYTVTHTIHKLCNKYTTNLSIDRVILVDIYTYFSLPCLESSERQESRMTTGVNRCVYILNLTPTRAIETSLRLNESSGISTFSY